MPEESTAVAPGVAAPQQSFAQRKAAQLSQERVEREAQAGGAPISPEAPGLGTPSGEMESAEDVGQDLSQGLYADEEGYQDDLEDSPGALDDEIPSGEDQAQETGDVDWEKRYNDLRSETQSILENRGEMDQEHAESMAQNLQFRFELEDQMNEAVQRAQYMRNVMSGNAQQYQNIDWSQVPPDKLQEVQAQAQQAFALAQQSDNVWQQMSEQHQQQLENIKQREAAIAKTRLRRTIPNWSNDTYGEIRDFAVEAGMPAQEFNDITNPVIIEALHAYRQIRKGASSVQGIKTTRKSQAPRGKAARRQPRDERGKFANKHTEPNQRGSFADKHRHRLAMERQGR